MPLKLILMRHAKSSWDDPLQSDHDRVLNARGRDSAIALGKWLRKLEDVPDETLSSSSQRTRETYELLGFDAEARFSRSLYLAGADLMLRELQNATGKTVLMLGHNPGISEFAERLASKLPAHARFLDYPTCATTVFEFSSDNWQDVGFGQGVVKAFAIPRELI
ncbi:phosphohistidine phosphatase [Shimia gijangensis]|uniref:Phosphohistidine phosphatase n=1 Tax=Shimia gijangensis TaxID=1470563 RepID=A0A1M6M538_9RHOB|nr:histidine phosphatase family protein [Shimia gijangensis]SHJ78413.1 phosphohistidine phosphatase [Shimia gijangensis]